MSFKERWEVEVNSHEVIYANLERRDEDATWARASRSGQGFVLVLINYRGKSMRDHHFLREAPGPFSKLN